MKAKKEIIDPRQTNIFSYIEKEKIRSSFPYVLNKKNNLNKFRDNPVSKFESQFTKSLAEREQEREAKKAQRLYRIHQEFHGFSRDIRPKIGRTEQDKIYGLR